MEKITAKSKKLGKLNDENVIMESGNFERISREENYSRIVGIEEDRQEWEREKKMLSKKKKNRIESDSE